MAGLLVVKKHLTAETGKKYTGYEVEAKPHFLPFLWSFFPVVLFIFTFGKLLSWVFFLFSYIYIEFGQKYVITPVDAIFRSRCKHEREKERKHSTPMVSVVHTVHLGQYYIYIYIYIYIYSDRLCIVSLLLQCIM